MAAPTRVLYLDVDDEITSAAARVRGVEAARVALVIPPGSRVATSRINFRLLARDATTHGRRLAIVAPDAGSRALAAAAGLEVYASVAEYEAAVLPGGTGDGAAVEPGAEPIATGAAAVPDGGAPGAAGTGAAGLAGAAGVAGVAGAAGAAGAVAPGPSTAPRSAVRRSRARTPIAPPEEAAAPPNAGAEPSAVEPAPPAQPAPSTAGPAPSTAAVAGAAAMGASTAGAAPSAPSASPVGLEMSTTVATPAPLQASTTAPSPTPIPTSSPVATPAPVPSPDLRPRSGIAGSGPVAASAGRRVPRGPLLAVALGLVAVVLLVGGVAAYLLLPSATIVVRPRVEPVPPVEMTVTADPAATSVDTQAGVVPAQTVTLPVEASGTYKATGARVVESKATGTVRFTNCDPTASYTVKAGTTVRTRDRIAFLTDEAVLLPVASIDFTPLPTIKCQSRDVGVTAAKAGPEGNVPAGAIRVVPGNLNSNVIQVTNRAPTEGGARESFPKVTQKDVDAAKADLTKQLQAAFAAQVADPTNAPAGTTVFPETATLGEPTFEPDPASYVDQEVATFDLSASASGTVLAVDEAPVSDVAAARLRDSIDSDHDLVADSVEVKVGDATADGQLVRFPATATGQQVRRLDPAAMEEQVLGLTPEEAQQQLSPYGDVQVALTPDWATTIPTYAFRVEVRVEGAPQVEDGGPTPAPSGS